MLGKHLHVIEGNIDQNTVIGRNVYVRQQSALNLYTVLLDAIAYVNVLQVLLLQFALEPESARQAVLHNHVKGLVDRLHVVALSGKGAVGQHYAIAAESTVVGCVAEVATVSPIVLVGLTGDRHTQALILPVPDKLASHCREGLVDLAEHILLVAHSVTHGVGVLALDMWLWLLAALVFVVSAYRCAEHTAVGTIHGAADIAPSAVAFVVSDSAGIQLLDGLHHILEVIAATAFISTAPSKDTGMVAECAHLAFVTLDHRSTEQLYAAQSLIAVALYIGLCQNI